MEDIYRNIVNSCPWTTGGFADKFWAFFRFSELFLQASIYVVSFWNMNIHILAVSLGLTINSITIMLYQWIFGWESPFIGCGELKSTPSGFAQEVAFFYILFVGYLFVRKYLVSNNLLYLVSIWSVFTLFSLLYFPFNTHFQVIVGVMIGSMQGFLYLVIIVFFFMGFLEKLQEKIERTNATSMLSYLFNFNGLKEN